MATKDLKVNVSADVKGFKEGMSQVAYETDKTEQRLESMIKELGPLKKAMVSSKKEAENLAYQFAMLSAEEKKSEFGQALAAKMNDAIKKSAELTDVLSDTRTMIKNLSSDTQYLDAAVDGFQAIGDGVTAVLGGLATVTGNQKQFNQAIAAYATVEKTAQAVQKVRNMFLKEGNVMLAIKRMQELAATKATELQAAATGKATIAQKLFNAAAKANPYVILATALIAVTAAIGTYIVMSNKAKKAEEERAAAQEREKEANDEYTTVYKKNVSETAGKYDELRATWNKLKTDQEKNEFLKDNKEWMEKYAAGVDTATAAEQFFNEETDNVVASFNARAKAAAAAAKATKLYDQMIDIELKKAELEKQRKSELTAAILEGDTDQRSMSQAARRRGLVINKVARINEDYKAQEAELDKQKSGIQGQIDTTRDIGFAANAEAKEHEKKTHLGHGGKNTPEKNKPSKVTPDKKEITEAAGSLEDYRKQLAELKREQETGLNKKGEIIQPLKAEDYIKQVDDLKKKIEDKEIELGIKVKEPEAEEGSIEYFNKKIQDLTKQQKTLTIGSEGWQEIQAQIDELKGQQATLEFTTNKDKFQAEIDKILEDAQKTDIKVDVDTQYLSDAQKTLYDNITTTINNLEQAAEKYMSALEKDDLPVEQQQMLNDKLSETNRLLDEQKEKRAQLEAQANERKEKAEDIKNNADAWGYYGDMLSSVGNAMSFLGDNEAAMAAQFALNSAAQIANAVKSISAMYAEAMAAGTLSGSKLPFPANIAAIATVVATIGSIFASLPKFDSGGIIPGGVSLHDNRLAQVSSGEMILNKRQQNNLFNAIDQNKIGGGTQKVEFVGKVSGKDIILVQKNYKKITHTV